MTRPHDVVAETAPVKNTPSLLKRWRMRNAHRMATVARLRRNQRGSAAVEFAIIAPLFFLLMFVIAETALVFIAEQVMDNAVFETVRLIRTGQVQSGGWSDEDFQDEICERMSVFIDCTGNADFYLDIQSYDAFEDMDVAQPLDDDEEFETAAAFEFGEASSIVVVRAYYKWPTSPIYDALTLGNLSSGKRLIGSFAAFRNEPYTE